MSRTSPQKSANLLSLGDWYLWWGVALTLSIGFMLIFSDGITNVASHWQQEEYSHGYIIPVLSLLLAWRQRKVLAKLPLKGSWFGLAAVLLGLAFFVLGELGGLYVIIHLSFLITLTGLVLSAVGWRGLAALWAPLVFLVFMLPIPDFLFNQLSLELQLISSAWGVFFLRLFGISVFLDGNVIDLGSYQLLIVEACSGLRYLFPLMTFGFICAYLFRIPVWQRLILFVSTVPITIVMNSFRIAVVGVLVEQYGREAAEGFIHDFEGWVIFMACVAVLFLLVWLMSWFIRPRPKLLDLLPVDMFDVVPRSYPSFRFQPPLPLVGSVVAVVAMAAGSTLLAERADALPIRKSFETFPLKIGDWYGERIMLERTIVDAIRVDDFVSANYRRLWDDAPVNLLVTYYENQRKGASAHSPQSCLPGGGWSIEAIEPYTVQNVFPDGSGLKVNRAIISKGGARQLVYYWFQQRDRILTNEYLVKYFLFWDAVTRNRTDGALVRFMTHLPDGEDVHSADERVGEFLRTMLPELAGYLPN